MDNTPDYKENLAFAPGDWSDSGIKATTDRTVSMIAIVDRLERLQTKYDMAVGMLMSICMTLEEEKKLPNVVKDIKDLLSILRQNKKEKYITFHTGKWTFQHKGKYLGRYATLDEAIYARDEYLKNKQ